MTKAQTHNLSTIRGQILSFHDEGLTPHQIALAVDRSVDHVRAVIWAAQNPERWRAIKKKAMKRYDAARYGTPEYRKQNAKYVRERYNSDPAFRQARIEAVKRFKDKRRAEARAQ